MSFTIRISPAYIEVSDTQTYFNVPDSIKVYGWGEVNANILH